MADPIGNLRFIKYALLQTTIGPSLLCDLLVFFHFIRHWRKEIVSTPQNHVILCLLIASFIQKIADVPFAIYYLRWGVVFQQTYNFCVVWDWFNYSAMTVSVQLVAWCCIERHLFIFHSQLMRKQCCLILLHYVPLITCLVYTPFFYLRYIFFPTTCTNTWDYTIIYCGGACYSYFNPFVGTFDWIFNYGVPSLVIIFANFLLFCRVIWQKIKQGRAIQWHRQKRMIIQLAFVCMLYFIFMLPQVIVGSIQTLWSPTFLSDIQANYFYYIVYFINQFLPFIIVSSLPEMHKDVKRWIQRIKRHFTHERQIYPTGTTTATVNRPIVDA
jgi:hypothetical protein